MIEVLKQALEALEQWNTPLYKRGTAIQTLHQAIAELESQKQGEPVACKECHLKDTVYDLLGDLKVANLKLSVRSQRTWVGLTDEDIEECLKGLPTQTIDVYARKVEAKLKEKNT